MHSITVTFVGGNADRRQLVLSQGCDGMMPPEQLFSGSRYLFDADTNTYRYWPTTGSNADENQFGSPTCETLFRRRPIHYTGLRSSSATNG